MPAQDTQLLDILLKLKAIDEAAAAKVKKEALSANLAVEELLLKHNLVDKEALARSKAAMLKVPYVDVEHCTRSGGD